MPLVQAKCTNCGANLEIDNTLDAAVCPYCNVPFVVEKAINNYNTANHINAGVVNVYARQFGGFCGSRRRAGKVQRRGHGGRDPQ